MPSHDVRPVRSLRLVPVTLCLLLFGGPAPPAAPDSIPVTDTGIRLILIGLDGADWQIASPLIEAGRLPHLGRLRKEGAWGDLRSTTPMLSPLLWTSIATGKPPDQHGIIDFLVRDPRTGQKVPISSTFRKTKAIWNIYSDAGRSTDFIAWWATWPAETINGRMVSDRLAYSLFGYQSRPEDAVGLVSPPGLMEKVAALRVDESQVTPDELRRFARISEADLAASRAKLKGDSSQAYADPINHLVRILASTRTYHRIALALLREGKRDLLSVYYQGIDEVCHRFAQYLPPKLPWVDAAAFDKYKDVVTRFYEYQDELVGELLRAAGAGATVAVISDHGFVSGSDRPDFPPDIELKAGRWHRQYGILVLSGPGIQPGKLEPRSLYDVAPTLLYLSGLPVATDMAGRPILDAIAPSFQSRFKLATLPTYEDPTGRGAGTETAASASPAAVDEEILARLRSLGYIAATEIGGGSAPGEESAPATLTNMINMATLEIQKGDLARAEEIVRSILSKKPDHGNSHMLLSEVLELQGRHAEALQEARTALNLLEELPERLLERYGRLARRLDALGEAKEFFLRATQIRTGRPEPWLGLGIAQSLGEEVGAAQSSLLRALEMSPRSVTAATWLSNIYDRSAGKTEILTAVEKAAGLNPDSAAHHAILGILYSKRAQPQRAQQELERALQLDPEHPEAIAAQAELMMSTGRLEEARRVLERAVARRSDQVEVRLALGRVHAKMGRMGEATREMSEAARVDPSSATAHAQLGMILMMQGQTQRAIPSIERALELEPSLYELRMHLAVMYHDTGRLRECEAHLLKAVELRPREAEPRRLLAGLYEEQGRREEAARELAKLREITGGG